MQPPERPHHAPSYAQAHCGEAAVDQQVEEKITAYLTWLERNPSKQGQLLLSFYEKRKKQAWFAAHEERLYWEQWYDGGWVVGRLCTCLIRNGGWWSYLYICMLLALLGSTAHLLAPRTHRYIPLSLLPGSYPASPRIATSPSAAASEGTQLLCCDVDTRVCFVCTHTHTQKEGNQPHKYTKTQHLVCSAKQNCKVGFKRR